MKRLEYRAAYQILFDADNKGTNREGSTNDVMVRLIAELCTTHSNLPHLKDLGSALEKTVSADQSQIIAILEKHNRVIIPAGWSCRQDGNHSLYIALERKRNAASDWLYSFSFFNLGAGANILQRTGQSHKGLIVSPGFKTDHIFKIKPKSLDIFLRLLLAPLQNPSDKHLENFDKADVYYERLTKLMLAYLSPEYQANDITNTLPDHDAHHTQRSGTCTYKSFAAALPAILPNLADYPDEIRAVKTSLKIACLSYVGEVITTPQIKLDFEQACMRVAQRLSKPANSASPHSSTWRRAFESLLDKSTFFPHLLKEHCSAPPITDRAQLDTLDDAVQPRLSRFSDSDPSVIFVSREHIFNIYFFGLTPIGMKYSDRQSLLGERNYPSEQYLTNLIPEIKKNLENLCDSISTIENPRDLSRILKKFIPSDAHHDMTFPKSKQDQFIYHVIGQVHLLLKCLATAQRILANRTIGTPRNKHTHVYVFCTYIYHRFLKQIDTFNNRPSRLSQVGYLDPVLIEIQNLCHQISHTIIALRPSDFDTTLFCNNLPELTQWDGNKFHASFTAACDMRWYYDEVRSANKEMYNVYYQLKHIFEDLERYLNPFRRKKSYSCLEDDINPYDICVTVTPTVRYDHIWHDIENPEDRALDPKTALTYVSTSEFIASQRAAQRLRFVTSSHVPGEVIAKLAEFIQHDVILYHKEYWDGFVKFKSELYDRQRFLWASFIRDQHFQINAEFQEPVIYLAETLAKKIKQLLDKKSLSHACHLLHGLTLLIDYTPINDQLYKHAIEALEHCKEYIGDKATPSDFLGMHTLLFAKLLTRYIDHQPEKKTEITLRYISSLVAFNYAANRIAASYLSTPITFYLKQTILSTSQHLASHSGTFNVADVEESTIEKITEQFGINELNSIRSIRISQKTEQVRLSTFYQIDLINPVGEEKQIKIFPLGDIISPFQIACPLPNSIITNKKFQKLFSDLQHVSDSGIANGRHHFQYGSQYFMITAIKGGDLEIFYRDDSGTYQYHSYSREQHLAFDNKTQWNLVNEGRHLSPIRQITLSLPLHQATETTLVKTDDNTLFKTSMPLWSHPFKRILETENDWVRKVSTTRQALFERDLNPTEKSKLSLPATSHASTHSNYRFLHLGLSFSQDQKQSHIFHQKQSRIFCDQYPGFYLCTQQDIVNYFSEKTSFDHFLTLTNDDRILIIIPRAEILSSSIDLISTDHTVMRFNEPPVDLNGITTFTTDSEESPLSRYYAFEWNQEYLKPSSGDINAQILMIYILSIADNHGNGIKAAIRYFDDYVTLGDQDRCSNQIINQILHSSFSHPEMNALKQRLAPSRQNESKTDRNIQSFLKPFGAQYLDRPDYSKHIQISKRVLLTKKEFRKHSFLVDNDTIMPRSADHGDEEIQFRVKVNPHELTIPGVDSLIEPTQSLSALNYPVTNFDAHSYTNKAQIHWFFQHNGYKLKQQIGTGYTSYYSTNCIIEGGPKFQFLQPRISMRASSIKILSLTSSTSLLLNDVTLSREESLQFLSNIPAAATEQPEVYDYPRQQLKLEGMITHGIKAAQEERPKEYTASRRIDQVEADKYGIEEIVKGIYKKVDQTLLVSERFISPRSDSFHSFLQCLSRPEKDAKQLLGADDTSYKTLKELISVWLWHSTEIQAMNRPHYQVRQYSFDHPHAYLILLLEHTENIRLRKSQLHMINHLCEPNEDGEFPPRIVEAIMGDGKTTVAGTLALARAQKLDGKVSFLLLPDGIFNQQSKDIQNQLRRTYGIETPILLFNREDQRSSTDPWKKIIETLKLAKSRKTPILTTAQTLAAIDNTQKELMLESQSTTYINTALQLIREGGKITDEYDSVYGFNPLVYSFQPNPQHHFSSGEGNQCSDESHFTKSDCKIFSLLFPELFRVYKPTREKTSQRYYERHIRNTLIRNIMTGTQEKIGLHKIARKLNAEKAVLQLLENADASPTWIQQEIASKVPSGTTQESIDSLGTTVKWVHRFIHQILPNALAMDPNLSYGLDSRKPNCKTVIPYTNGAPSYGSRFENSLLTLTLTVLRAFNDGFSLEQFNDLIFHFLPSHVNLFQENRRGTPISDLTKLIPLKKYEAFYENLLLYPPESSNEALKEKIKSLFIVLSEDDRLKVCWKVIEIQIIPKITYNTTKIRHSWPSSERESGFTGTTHEMDKFINIEGPKSRIVDGRTLSELLKIEKSERNCRFYSHEVASDIVPYCESKPNTRAIIDVGDLLKAHLPNYSMHDYVAQNRHGIYRATGCKAIFYFEKGEFFAIKQDDVKPILLTQFNENYIQMQVNVPINERFWFFSARFSRGVDSKLHPTGEVLVMVCEDNSLASILQGIKRARGLGLDQQEPSFVLAKDFMEHHKLSASEKHSEQSIRHLNEVIHTDEKSSTTDKKPLTIDMFWRMIIKKDGQKLKEELFSVTTDYIDAIYKRELNKYFNRKGSRLSQDEHAILRRFFLLKSPTPAEIIETEKSSVAPGDELERHAIENHSDYSDFFHAIIHSTPDQELKNPDELHAAALDLIEKMIPKLPEEIDLFGNKTNEAVNEKEQQQYVAVQQERKQEQAATRKPNPDSYSTFLDPMPLQTGMHLPQINNTLLVSKNYRSVSSAISDNKFLLHQVTAVMLTKNDVESQSRYPARPFILLDASDHALFLNGDLKIPQEIQNATPLVIYLGKLPEYLINNPIFSTNTMKVNLISTMLISGNINWLWTDVKSKITGPFYDTLFELCYKTPDAIRLIKAVQPSFKDLSVTGEKSISALIPSNSKALRGLSLKLEDFYKTKKAPLPKIKRSEKIIFNLAKRWVHKRRFSKKLESGKKQVAKVRNFIAHSSSGLNSLYRFITNTQLVAMALALIALLFHSNIIMYLACALNLFATINDIRFRNQHKNMTSHVKNSNLSVAFKAVCNHLFTFEIFSPRKALLQYQTPFLLKAYRILNTTLKLVVTPAICGAWLLGYPLSVFYVIAAIATTIATSLLTSTKINKDYSNWQQKKSSISRKGYQIPQTHMHLAASIIPRMHILSPSEPINREQMLGIKHQLCVDSACPQLLLKGLVESKTHGVSLRLNLAAGHPLFTSLTKNFIRLVDHLLKKSHSEELDSYQELLAILLLAQENNIYVHPNTKLPPVVNTALKKAYASLESKYPINHTISHLYELLIKNTLNISEIEPSGLASLLQNLQTYNKSKQASLVIACLGYAEANNIKIDLPMCARTPAFYKELTSVLQLLALTGQQIKKSKQALYELFYTNDQQIKELTKSALTRYLDLNEGEQIFTLLKSPEHSRTHMEIVGCLLKLSNDPKIHIKLQSIDFRFFEQWNHSIDAVCLTRDLVKKCKQSLSKLFYINALPEKTAAGALLKAAGALLKNALEIPDEEYVLNSADITRLLENLNSYPKYQQASLIIACLHYSNIRNLVIQLSPSLKKGSFKKRLAESIDSLILNTGDNKCLKDCLHEIFAQRVPEDDKDQEFELLIREHPEISDNEPLTDRTLINLLQNLQKHDEDKFNQANLLIACLWHAEANNIMIELPKNKKSAFGIFVKTHEFSEQLETALRSHSLTDQKIKMIRQSLNELSHTEEPYVKIERPRQELSAEEGSKHIQSPTTKNKIQDYFTKLIMPKLAKLPYQISASRNFFELLKENKRRKSLRKGQRAEWKRQEQSLLLDKKEIDELLSMYKDNLQHAEFDKKTQQQFIRKLNNAITTRANITETFFVLKQYKTKVEERNSAPKRTIDADICGRLLASIHSVFHPPHRDDKAATSIMESKAEPTSTATCSSDGKENWPDDLKHLSYHVKIESKVMSLHEDHEDTEIEAGQYKMETAGDCIEAIKALKKTKIYLQRYVINQEAFSKIIAMIRSHSLRENPKQFLSDLKDYKNSHLKDVVTLHPTLDIERNNEQITIIAKTENITEVISSIDYKDLTGVISTNEVTGISSSQEHYTHQVNPLLFAHSLNQIKSDLNQAIDDEIKTLQQVSLLSDAINFANDEQLSAIIACR